MRAGMGGSEGREDGRSAGRSGSEGKGGRRAGSGVSQGEGRVGGVQGVITALQLHAQAAVLNSSTLGSSSCTAPAAALMLQAPTAPSIHAQCALFLSFFHAAGRRPSLGSRCPHPSRRVPSVPGATMRTPPCWTAAASLSAARTLCRVWQGQLLPHVPVAAWHERAVARVPCTPLQPTPQQAGTGRLPTRATCSGHLPTRTICSGNLPGRHGAGHRCGHRQRLLHCHHGGAAAPPGAHVLMVRVARRSTAAGGMAGRHATHYVFVPTPPLLPQAAWPADAGQRLPDGRAARVLRPAQTACLQKPLLIITSCSFAQAAPPIPQHSVPAEAGQRLPAGSPARLLPAHRLHGCNGPGEAHGRPSPRLIEGRKEHILRLGRGLRVQGLLQAAHRNPLPCPCSWW